MKEVCAVEAFAVNVLSVGSGRTRAHSTDNHIIKKSRTLDTLPGNDFSVHAHHYCKLEYIIECDGFAIRINDCKTQYKPGYIFFQPAYTLHTPTNRYAGEVQKLSMSFFINTDFSKEIGDAPFCLPCPEDMKELFYEILEDKKKAPESIGAINVKAERLLKTVAASPLRRDIAREAENDGEGAEFLGLVKYICEHYYEDLTLADLANFVYKEKTYFAKKFKSIYNITPVNYLYAVRLSRSLDELTFSDASIEQIALKVGFKSASAYCSAFRRAYDIAPKEYRKRAKRIWMRKRD